MKWMKWMIAPLFAALVLPASVFAQEGARSYQIHNRLRLEYDDNIRQVDSNKESSFKVIEEVEILVNFNLETTFVSFRYKPSFVWWENRDEDSTDLHHDFDFIFNHIFSPRVSLSVKDTLRYAELPELIDRDLLVRPENTFFYNQLNAALTVLVNPQTRAEIAGRYNLLRYDDSEVAAIEDYDLMVGGLTLRHYVLPETAVAADFRVETIEYDEIDRGSDSVQGGLGVEHMFNPNFLAGASAGYQRKEFSDADASSESSPYADLNVTFVPSPATRITLGAGYSLFEADVYPFVNQTRTRFFASLTHDLTAKIALNVAGTYLDSDYEADQQARDEEVRLGDGTEEIVQFSTRVTYKVNRSNWLEAGWQFTMLDSDLREDFERNRIHVGWKTQL